MILPEVGVGGDQTGRHLALGQTVSSAATRSGDILRHAAQGGAKRRWRSPTLLTTFRIDGNVSGFGPTDHREFAMASGEMSPTSSPTSSPRVMTTSTRARCRARSISTAWIGATRAKFSRPRDADTASPTQLCVWVKDTAGMGSMYRSQHEFVFVFKHGRERHRNNVELGRYGRNRTNVWNYPGANRSSFVRGGKSDRAASDVEAGRDGRRRDHGCLGARRHRARSFLGAAPPSSRRSVPAGAVTASRSIPCIAT